jgi:hypothetical protein
MNHPRKNRTEQNITITMALTREKKRMENDRLPKIIIE